MAQLGRDDLGKLAYERYCLAVGGVAFNGDALPTWEGQASRNPKIVEAWRQAALVVAAAILGDDE